MTSQKSFSSDLRLLKTTIAQNKYVLFLYTAVLFLLVSLPGILTCTQIGLYQESLEMYQNFQAQLLNLLSGYTLYSVFGFLALGFITAVLMYSFLYHKTAVNFFHSTPYKRHELYWVRFVGGIVLILIPLVIVYAVNLITAASASLLTLDAFGQITYGLFLNFLYFLTIYCVAIFCATLSGNIFAQICLQGFIYLVYPVTRMVMIGAFYSWFETYQTNVDMITANMNYIFPVYQLLSISRDTFHLPAPTLLYNLAYCLVFAVLGLLIYRIRKSENCNKFYTVKAVTVFLKYFITTVGAIGIGVLFYSFSAQGTNWAGGIIATILGALLLFCVIQAVFAKNIRAMFAHKKQFGVYIVILTLVVCVGMFDLVGYDTRVPKASQVVSLSIDISNFNNTTGDSQILLKDRSNVEKAVELIQKSAKYNRQNVPENRNILSVSIQKTTSPFIMERTYSYANADDITAFMEAVANTEEYKSGYAKNFAEIEDLDGLQVSKFETNTIYVDFNKHNGTYNNAENVRYRNAVPALRSAFQTDVKNCSYEQVQSSEIYAWLRLDVREKRILLDGENLPGATAIRMLPVYTCYENTIAVLKEHYAGALDPGSLPSRLRIQVYGDGNTIENYETKDAQVIQEVLQSTSSSFNRTESGAWVYGDNDKPYGTYCGKRDIPNDAAFSQASSGDKES